MDPMAPIAPTVINSEDEFKALLKSSTIVITDFWAEWCAPCKSIAPLFNQHAAKYGVPSKITFAKINIDAVPEVAAQHRITTIPTFLFFKSGEPYADVRTASPPKLQKAVEEAVEELRKMEDTGCKENAEPENVLAKDIENEDW